MVISLKDFVLKKKYSVSEIGLYICNSVNNFRQYYYYLFWRDCCFRGAKFLQLILVEFDEITRKYKVKIWMILFFVIWSHNLFQLTNCIKNRDLSKALFARLSRNGKIVFHIFVIFRQAIYGSIVKLINCTNGITLKINSLTISFRCIFDNSLSHLFDFMSIR